MKNELNSALQKLSLHVERSPLAVIDWDTSFCVSAWNPAAERIFGFSHDEAIGKHASFIIPDAFHKYVNIVWNDLLVNHGGTRSTNENVTKSGKTISCEWYNTPVFDDLGKIVSVSSLAQDITEQVKYLEALEYQTYHDTLTSLYSREWLTEYIETSINDRPEERFSLFFIDLDRFKEINNTLGHDVGDTLLVILSHRLSETADSRNDKVARLGGDEFAVLTTNHNVVEVANQVLKDLEKPVELSGIKLDIGASIGVAWYPEHGNNSTSLMRCADIAMYKAKETNNQYIEYSTDIDQHSADRLILLSDLRRAINDDQLILYFQPKINIRQNKHIGYEALLRWRHPERGLVPPDEFIPYAEVSGLIQSLTMWVLENSMIQMSEWSKQGVIHNISINLSTRNLLDDNLPGEMVMLMKKYEIDPAAIELEVTESAVMTDPEHALRNLKRLHETGVELSIDDFGTGYSSLAYLR